MAMKMALHLQFQTKSGLLFMIIHYFYTCFKEIFLYFEHFTVTLQRKQTGLTRTPIPQTYQFTSFPQIPIIFKSQLHY